MHSGGSRASPGKLSPDLSAAISEVAQQISDLADPLAVIAAVSDTFASSLDAVAEIALPRLRAVAELRPEGCYYDRLAEAPDLSKGHVAQLAREARRRRL